MKKIIKKLFLYFILFTIIKIILSYFISAPSTFSDSYHYIKVARSFFNSQEFSIHENLFYRQPFYPIILSISYLFKNMVHVFLAMKIINAIVSSLIIFSAWLLSKEFLSEKKALTSAILISLIPSNFAFTPFIMSENLFYPLFLFSIYFIYKSFTENNYKYNILSGLFIALSMLTRTFGIILLVLFILLNLIQFIRRKTQPNPLIFLIIFLLIISPWVLKTTSQLGFSGTNMMGSHSEEAFLLFTNIFSLTFYIQVLLYLCYIILATGILFSFTSIFSFKKIFENEKYLLLSLIILFTTFSMIVICANHSIGDAHIFKLLGWRPVGRYIETILPLIFVAGFIGLDSYEKNKKDFEKYFKITTLFLFPFLIFSSFLATFPLFPVNNMSLTWVGILRYIFEYIYYNKTSFDIIPSWSSLIFLVIIFLLILFFMFLLRKKLLFKKTMSIFIIFFLSVSLLNYAVTYYNTEKYWYKGEQMQLGLWLNKYDKGNSLIIFDERDCIDFISKLDQTSICEPTKTATIIGIWLNNNIKINDVSNPPKNSIVISRHILNFHKIKETESGIFVYKNI